MFCYRIDDLAEMYQMIILVSPAMYFLASISLLHAMLNLIAELTRFADREFYLVSADMLWNDD